MKQKKNFLLIALILLKSPLLAKGKIAVIQTPPSEPMHYYFLALKGAYEHASGQFSRAQETYEALTSRSPGDKSLQQARLYASFQAGSYEALTQEYERGRIEDPDVLFFVAQSYLFQTHFEKALHLFKELAAKNQSDGRLLYSTAACLIHLGRASDAQILIAQGLENQAHASRHHLLLFLQAKLLLAQGDLEKAKEAIARALSLQPSFIKGLYLQGAIHEQGHDYVRARASYEAAQALAPQDETLRRRLLGLEQKNQYIAVMSALKRKDFVSAESATQRLLEENKGDVQAQELTIACLVAQEKFTQLQQELTSWLNAFPVDRGLMKRLLALRTKKMPIRMLSAVFEKAASAHPTWQLCFAAADLLHEQKHYEQARAWYERALADKSEQLDALTKSQLHHQIAGSFYSQGRLAECRTALTQALAGPVVCPESIRLEANL